MHSDGARIYRDIILWSLHTVYSITQHIAPACIAFCLGAAFATLDTSAQQLPFAPGLHSTFPQPYEEKMPAAVIAAETPPSIAVPIPKYSAVYGTGQPTSRPRTVDSKFVTLNTLYLGMALLDVELTQRCIASRQCREGNPLMPSSRAAQFSIGIGYAALGSSASYWLKKHKSPHWWLPPAIGIAGHAAGIATGAVIQ